ncbi:hypothetical protein LUX33_45885 [Actinomadura madurae]|uniref:hypothetical protein n=1 Tax=Actinomadura madurae TaxID=1993 RepID=UPI0020D23CA7|nr:hypothetical protein [Actinomadura madurae]MCP9954983.1 hypothetical protein [Actinomadura madurae]MCP9971718.1 hypothetical protein [Actinomadura madurae]
MIILSGVLVVVAIALLVAGIVAGNGDSAQVFGLDALVVIYISIAVSIVSALCLAIGVFLRRKELFGPGVPVAPARTTKKAKKDKRKKSTPPAPAKAAPSALEAAAPPAEPADDEVEVPVPPADVPDDALVFVVRGRKRYHLDTCRQLAGRETEELTYAEAREEGFSSCTACMPDTALAARAAASAPASSDAGRAAGARPAAATGPGAERSEGGLAGIARPGALGPVLRQARVVRQDGRDPAAGRARAGRAGAPPGGAHPHRHPRRGRRRLRGGGAHGRGERRTRRGGLRGPAHLGTDR